MTEPTIAMGFVKAFVDFAISRGADRQVLLQQSRIRPEELENDDGRLALVNYIDLIEAGTELCTSRTRIALW